MHEFKIDNTDYLAVGIPKNANRLKVFNDERPYVSYFDGIEIIREYLPLPFGTWEIAIPSTLNCTEEEAIMVVEGKLFEVLGTERYWNYLNLLFEFETALESLHTLLQSQGITDNNVCILKKLK